MMMENVNLYLINRHLNNLIVRLHPLLDSNLDFKLRLVLDLWLEGRHAC